MVELAYGASAEIGYWLMDSACHNATKTIIENSFTHGFYGPNSFPISFQH